MKKEYSAPDFEIIEFDSIVATDGSKVHDGSETECTCTSFNGYDFTQI